MPGHKVLAVLHSEELASQENQIRYQKEYEPASGEGRMFDIRKVNDRGDDG
jgi:hypothetical protein